VRIKDGPCEIELVSHDGDRAKIRFLSFPDIVRGNLRPTAVRVWDEKIVIASALSPLSAGTLVPGAAEGELWLPGYMTERDDRVVVIQTKYPVEMVRKIEAIVNVVAAKRYMEKAK